MRILLVGEYSRLHNSLKEGLVSLGHEVLLISTGDGFKQYPSDILLKRPYEQGLSKKMKVGVFKTIGIDITTKAITQQFFKHKTVLKDFDVVQLINENPLGTSTDEAIKIISFLKQHNKKLFLLSCGTDYISVSHMLSDAHPYSILKGYKEGSVAKENYQWILKYVSPPYKALHQFIYSTIDGVLASDLDYHIPLQRHPLYKGLMPNPINISNLDIPELKPLDPIRIFMGINRGNYHTKGIVYFEEALQIIQQKYPDNVVIDIVENLPYKDYINRYNKAHIVLDQVLAYDQGYNALEAMAKGKVVFTGAEHSFEDYYKLTAPVAINALPDVAVIVRQLAQLIENPQQIKEIGERAKQFIAKEHDHIKVAKKYVSVWGNKD